MSEEMAAKLRAIAEELQTSSDRNDLAAAGVLFTLLGAHHADDLIPLAHYVFSFAEQAHRQLTSRYN